MGFSRSSRKDEGKADLYSEARRVMVVRRSSRGVCSCRSLGCARMNRSLSPLGYNSSTDGLSSYDGYLSAIITIIIIIDCNPQTQRKRRRRRRR